MSDPSDLVGRLRQALEHLAQVPPSSPESGTADALGRCLERTLSQFEEPSPAEATGFQFRMTGGRPLIFLKNQAVPMDPMGILRLIRICGLELRPGEVIDLDEELVASFVRQDVARVSAELGVAEEVLRRAMAPRERDHAVAGVADRNKIRLRGRLNQLVSTLQAAQKGSQA